MLRQRSGSLRRAAIRNRFVSSCLPELGARNVSKKNESIQNHGWDLINRTVANAHEPLSQFRLCYPASTPVSVSGREEASWRRWWLLLIPTKYIYSHLPRVQVENVAANHPYNMGDWETWKPCIASSTVSPSLGSPQSCLSDANSPTVREAKWVVGSLKWFSSASSYPWCRFSHCKDPWLHDSIPVKHHTSRFPQMKVPTPKQK